jgi:predicted transcriptional regulator
MNARQSLKPEQKHKSQRGKPHDDSIKAQVMAALLLGCGVMEVATELGLPHSTVSTYKAQIPEAKLDEFRRKKGERLDELVYDYVITGLTALRKQAEVVSDATYIRQQGALSMATLHGVMADKLVRLLEVTTRARGGNEQRRLSDGESEGEKP